MSAGFTYDAAGPATIPDEALSASLIENFCLVAAGAATIPNETLPASLIVETSAHIAPDAASMPNWAPPLSSTADVHSQIAADSVPIPNETPPMSFTMSGPNIVYHVGNQEIGERQFREYMLMIPAGPERVELHKLYIRGKKHVCYEIKADLDLIKTLGLYEDVKARIIPVMQKAESNLLEWGRTEDILNEDPRAKTLAKIASAWGAYVCDHFRCSKESEHSLRAVATAARSVPDYTTARRLVNENILVRLEKATGSHYRRKRYATTTDWYGIRGMGPIHDPIDPMRLFAVGMHLGDLNVLEEGIV